MRAFVCVAAAFLVVSFAACASSEVDDAGGRLPEEAGISLGEGGFVDAGPVPDGAKPKVDGGFEGPDGSVVRADRFVGSVVSFAPGACAGFGLPNMPTVVQGPPVGAGDQMGGLDVVSLGEKGVIVLAFDTNAIVDGPGPDFIVFENAFYAAGDRTKPNAELASVSVSEDGQTWKAFPCTPTAQAPYGTCAGWHPVYAAPGNGISPVDPKTAGGDAFDLADVGMTRARYVRIEDLGTTACDAQSKPTTTGFDLDAVSIVNAETP